MANLVAYQNGNWTGSTTWKAVSTSTGAVQAAFTSSASTTTAYVGSSAFTTAASEVLEGVLLYCKRLNTTGTVSVAFSADGTTATSEITVNAADLPVDPSWVFFKFASSYTTSAVSTNKILVKGSSAGNATFYTDATANNWARLLRNSTPATAGASDVTYIAAELTGSETKTDITVTMDSTSLATAYGEVNIGYSGALVCGTATSTTYRLKVNGNLNIWAGGTLTIGTSTGSIPSSSSAEVEFVCGSAGQYGLEVKAGGTCIMYGATKTNTKALLTADAASGQSTITVADTTGWRANDTLIIGATFRANQTEKRVISSVTSGTQATLTAPLTNTHTGTGLYVGEVANVTRNIKIRGTSQSLSAYVYASGISTFDAVYVEFYWLGSGLTNKAGLESNTATGGSFSLKYCSSYDGETNNGRSLRAVGAAAITVEDCIFWAQSVFNPNLLVSAPAYFRRNWVFGNNNTHSISGISLEVSDNRFCGAPMTFSINSASQIGGVLQNNIFHSTTAAGLTLSGDYGIVISGGSIWRCNTYGLVIQGVKTRVTDLSSYHNTTANVYLGSGTNTASGASYFGNCSFDGGSGGGLSQTTNQVLLDYAAGALFDSCSFGSTQIASGFSALGNIPRLVDVTFRKCTIADSITVTNQSNLLETTEFTGALKFDKFNNTSGSHRTYKRYGRTEADQATYKTAAPSEALLPNTSGQKLPSGSKKFAVASGTTATVTVYVNKSATYNGNQPRLIVKTNSIAGIASDTVLATASGGTGSWLTLSGTTASVSDDCVLEVYVDCDGTAGTVYVDDWSIS